MIVAEGILGLALAYLACGVIFGTAFVIAGVQRLDDAANGASIGFRLLIFPGSVALWPYLALRWFRACWEGAKP
jgi:hypothetical protein